MALSHNDGGYKSRKWVGFCITSILIIVAGKSIEAAALPEVVFGLVSAYGLFCGANNMRDWVAMKSGKALSPPPAKEEPKKTVAKKDDEEEEEGS